MMSVTLPWLSMRMNALGMNAGFSAWAAPAKGRLKPTTKAPPAASPAWRNPRRVSASSDLQVASRTAALWMAEFCMALNPRQILGLRGLFDRRADAHVRAAAANVSSHGRIDVGILRVRSGVEQGRCRHDLSGLAVAALD